MNTEIFYLGLIYFLQQAAFHTLEDILGAPEHGFLDGRQDAALKVLVRQVL